MIAAIKQIGLDILIDNHLQITVLEIIYRRSYSDTLQENDVIYVKSMEAKMAVRLVGST